MSSPVTGGRSTANPSGPGRSGHSRSGPTSGATSSRRGRRCRNGPRARCRDGSAWRCVAALVGAVAGGGPGLGLREPLPADDRPGVLPDNGHERPTSATSRRFSHRSCRQSSRSTRAASGARTASAASSQGAGTGMIIEPSGVVLTNNHVIAGAQTVTVTLYGQTKPFPAKVIGTDAVKDIALVQIEGRGTLAADRPVRELQHGPARRRCAGHRQRARAGRWPDGDRGHRLGEGPVAHRHRPTTARRRT